MMMIPCKKTSLRFRAASGIAALLITGNVAQLNAETVVMNDPELAGISGFRDYWNTPVVLAEDGATRLSDQGRFGSGPVADWSTDQPGAIAFDAVHRSLLVRFPKAAEEIANRLNQGYRLERVELVLPYRDTEYFPLGYDMPAGMSFLGRMWVNTPPNWHALAWPLLQPWTADAKIGPTYNAAVNGQRYWQKYGARSSEKDRYATPFERAEVSKENPNGVIDLTSYFSNEALGKTLGERIRLFADAGLLIQKEEIYDARYWRGGYEWGVATGQRAIIVNTPELKITFKQGSGEKVVLPAGTELAWSENPVLEPTAVLPSPAEFAQLARGFKPTRPDWMPDWQWQRIQELIEVGGHSTTFPQSYEDYLKWIDAFLSLHPRAWKGFTAGDMAAEYAMFRTAIPAPVKDHLRLYWWAWLMPDREYTSLVQGYTAGKEAKEYYEATKDWRGNFSVYRTYMSSMGTTNFNSWAITGGMFGGWMLENERIIDEARRGYDRFMTRIWTWMDGSGQEVIDHYYFAHTLGPLKTVADYAPFPEERLAASINLEKHVDELIRTWHPNLNRFISSSGRTGIAYPLYLQDGLTYILNTLSPKSVLTDIGQTEVAGRGEMKDRGFGAFAFELSPAQVAHQAIDSPWAPATSVALVADKPYPYESIRSYVKWGNFQETPLWKKTYLSEHYGMASIDIAENETVPFMVQWRRKDAPVTSYRDLGTLLARYGINDTEFLDSLYHDDVKKVAEIMESGDRNAIRKLRRNPNGIVGTQAAPSAIVQGGNTAILFASPGKDLTRTNTDRKIPDEVTSLQMSLALFNLDVSPEWKLYLDGEPVTQLPASATFGQRITLHDGVSYLGMLPIPATNLGRQETEVLISTKGIPTQMQGGGEIKVTLTIDAFNYHSSTPFDAKADPHALDQAVAGYVIRAGDNSQYATFEAFQQAFAAAPFEYTLRGDQVQVTFGEPGNELTATFDPTAEWKPPTTNIFPERSYRGTWPYLAEGVHRDDLHSVQSTTGLLVKHGAVLQTSQGKMAYLKVYPDQERVIAINPFKEPVSWKLSLPGGQTVEANGLIGQCRMDVDLKHHLLVLDINPEEVEGAATALIFSSPMTVILNGTSLEVPAGGALSLH